MVGGSNHTVGFGRRALVESGKGILTRTKLRFVYNELWRAVRGVKGLAMNARFAGRPGLRSRLANLGVSLDSADGVIHGQDLALKSQTYVEPSQMGTFREA